MTIILYGGGPAFGLPEVSPYVTKTEVQLQLAGLDYRKELSRPEQSPKGQLPWIADGDEKVADTTFIRAYLERKYGFDLDEGLSEAERGQAWALERMLENHLGWIAAYGRFFISANFEKGPAHWFDFAPEEARDKLKRDLLAEVAARLKAIGVTRHSEEEMVWLGERSLAALAAQLGDKAYLFSDRPSGVDATAFAMLANIMTPFFDSPLTRSAIRYDNLVGYVDRMMATHYPLHRWRICGGGEVKTPSENRRAA
jgi:glutathione S-transferase